MIWPFKKNSPESDKETKGDDATYVPSTGMDADARKEAFWIIKKLTSLGAWKIKYEKYKIFVEEMERMARVYHDDMFYTANYKKVLDEFIHFERALAKLARGDRSCFRWGADGTFAYYHITPEYINRIISRPDEFIVEEDTSGLKAAIEGIRRVNAIGQESQQDGEPSWPWVTDWLSQKSIQKNGPYAVCYPLPEVPLHQPLVQVKTGEEITHTGIWEPNTQGAAMDYLLAGTEAPEVEVSYERGRENTVWTLLWIDERYKDGKIPEEEALYYVAPDPVPAPVDPIRCEAKQPCPRAGYWWSPAKDQSRRYFEQGEVMPDFPGSRYGLTIWMWDQNQNQH